MDAEDIEINYDRIRDELRGVRLAIQAGCAGLRNSLSIWGGLS